MTARQASWSEVAEPLRRARSYWLGTTDPHGAPHAVPLWGAVESEVLYLYSARRTAKARHVASDPRVVVHLESAEDVVIVHGTLEDLGEPLTSPAVIHALMQKYADPADLPYLPHVDASFDVLWRLLPQRALLWRLPDFADSQARWGS